MGGVRARARVVRTRLETWAWEWSGRESGIAVWQKVITVIVIAGE